MLILDIAGSSTFDIAVFVKQNEISAEIKAELLPRVSVYRLLSYLGTSFFSTSFFFKKTLIFLLLNNSKTKFASI